MSLQEKLARLKGTIATPEDLEALRALSPSVPQLVLDLLGTLPLAGASFSLSAEDDLSGLGAEFQVFTSAASIEEATSFYPGIVAGPRGFFPIALCLEGSGDPYFIDSSTGRVVRIPHDAARADGTLYSSCIEDVAESFDRFLELAVPY